MVDFAYRAADGGGRLVEGQLDARDRDEALRRLIDQGLTPVRILDRSEAKPAAPPAARRARRRLRLGADQPTRTDMLEFSGQLAVMLRAGLPLDAALRVLAGMDHRPVVAALLTEIHEAVKAGQPLSRALAGHDALFGPFYVNMVRSGEASGQLGAVLTRLVEHLERMRTLRESVVSALIYPAILLCVALLSVVGILTFVVPQFEALFRDARDALPWSTRIVLVAGEFIIAHGLSLLVVLVAAGVPLARWLMAPRGRRWLRARMAGLPLLGRIRHDYELAQFTRTFGTLLGNGVPILAALGIAAESVVDDRLRESIAGVTPKVKSGGRLAPAFEATGEFESLTVNLVRVAEETGTLDRMMLELAAILDRNVETAIRRALTLLEPALILGLGMFVAAVIVSILLGILTINDLAL